MQGLTAQVALEGAAFSFDKLYRYAVPPDLQKKVGCGCRVLIPFGKGNTKKQGMILSLETADLKGLKGLSALIDDRPVLTDEMAALCRYMHDVCFCTYYEAVRAMLPTGFQYRLIPVYTASQDFCAFSALSETEQAVLTFLKDKGDTAEDVLIRQFGVSKDFLQNLCEKQAIDRTVDTKRNLNDATQKFVRLSPEAEQFEDQKLTPRQTEVLRLVRDIGEVAVKEILYFTGYSVSVVNNLVQKGLLIAFEKKVYLPAYQTPGVPHKTALALTREQQAAADGLLAEYRKSEGAVSLLYGITGSGKTQVFLHLVDQVITEGRGVIMMVPEISLTPQMLALFTGRYGNEVAVFHSAMSMGSRMREWQRIKDGKAKIALGTRSAVFAPFEKLGLIIIDEEQEHTYKSEQSPRFHARELARFRTAYHQGLLCLASATPSIESYTAAKNDQYKLFTLTKRYGDAVLPVVETVDMKKEILNGNSSAFSHRLYEALDETLQKQKQAIILLNRRGHNTYVSCPNCGYVATCPHCSISLTYHSANHRMMCHYCGYSEPAGGKCPSCGGEHMKFLGLGTQKAEEEIKTLFKTARVLRLDADSTLARGSYAEYLTAFAAGEYDILIGTQMVAKGLDFPNVTLVGVLGADSAMYSEDFRSFERTFSLLTQVVGRAGRGKDRGLAIVQTMDPASNLIALAAAQDYDRFYEDEIATRRLMIYPPYCDICLISARSVDKTAAERALNGIFMKIKEMLKQEYADVKLIILGPSSATVSKVRNQYRVRMIIKCRNNKRLRTLIRTALEQKIAANVTVTVDMNPETVL